MVDQDSADLNPDRMCLFYSMDQNSSETVFIEKTLFETIQMVQKTSKQHLVLNGE